MGGEICTRPTAPRHLRRPLSAARRPVAHLELRQGHRVRQHVEAVAGGPKNGALLARAGLRGVRQGVSKMRRWRKDGGG